MAGEEAPGSVTGGSLDRPGLSPEHGQFDERFPVYGRIPPRELLFDLLSWTLLTVFRLERQLGLIGPRKFRQSIGTCGTWYATSRGALSPLAKFPESCRSCWMRPSLQVRRCGTDISIDREVIRVLRPSLMEEPLPRLGVRKPGGNSRRKRKSPSVRISLQACSMADANS